VRGCPLSDCSAPTELPASATEDLVVSGERAFWHTDAVGWVSADGASCQTLVYGDRPDSVDFWGVTDSSAYAGGRLGDAFGPLRVLRVPLD
jgi:hypothetical protein